ERLVFRGSSSKQSEIFTSPRKPRKSRKSQASQENNEAESPDSLDSMREAHDDTQEMNQDMSDFSQDISQYEDYMQSSDDLFEGREPSEDDLMNMNFNEDMPPSIYDKPESTEEEEL
ncbi:MAG: hypothetical protein IJQ56_05810, partial [Synergistaceae bacterium]|nr:hypothetical protein [Synergistaceae bacterium]